MITISLKVSEDLNARIRALAGKRKSNASAVVRRALEEYLAKQSKSFQGSVLDLARDLAGSVDGPRDLSTSRKYIRGYGR